MFYVGTLSDRGVTWQTFATKREAVAALAGAISIQKPAHGVWVIKKKG